MGKRIYPADKKLTKCREKLVLENQALVTSIVCKIFPSGKPEKTKHGVGTWDDAMQAGMLGLIRAAMHFNPKLGYQFSTYAYYAIRREVLNWLADEGTIRVPRYESKHKNKEQFAKYREAAAKVTSMFGDDFNDSEGRDWVPDTKPLPEYNDEHDSLGQQVALLPPRHRQVIKHRYWDGWCYKQIGKELGISTERARQLANAALSKLKKRMKAK